MPVVQRLADARIDTSKLQLLGLLAPLHVVKLVKYSFELATHVFRQQPVGDIVPHIRGLDAMDKNHLVSVLEAVFKYARAEFKQDIEPFVLEQVVLGLSARAREQLRDACWLLKDGEVDAFVEFRRAGSWEQCFETTRAHKKKNKK